MATNNQSQGAPTPFPLALLVCDDVVIDQQSQKKTIVGIFDAIHARQFPATHPSLVFYARLTDAEGHYRLRIEHVQIATDSILGEFSLEGDASNRLAFVDVRVLFRMVQLPEPGDYEFRLWANDRYIGRVKFRAVQLPGGESHD